MFPTVGFGNEHQLNDGTFCLQMESWCTKMFFLPSELRSERMHSPEMVTVAPGSITPLFGRTQYRRGAVVITLKHTLLSEGFFSLRLVVTTSVKGPERQKKKLKFTTATEYCKKTSRAKTVFLKYSRATILIKYKAAFSINVIMMNNHNLNSTWDRCCMKLQWKHHLPVDWLNSEY